MNRRNSPVGPKMLIMLAMTVAFALFMLRSSLLGGSGPTETGFDGVSPLANITEADAVERLPWEAPAAPRNPFLPIDGTDPTVGGADEGSTGPDADQLDQEVGS